MGVEPAVVYQRTLPERAIRGPTRLAPRPAPGILMLVGGNAVRSGVAVSAS